MRRAAYITTSWDDGHPLDLRVAELLARYGLQGTFYVPRTADTSTMTATQLRDLGSAFEIGAHTVHHVDLTAATDQQVREELVEAKAWIEATTGASCPMFCPPKGRFSRRHLPLVREAGYLGVRTVELLSIDLPRREAGLLLMPTTIQAYPHGWLSYARNIVKRGAWANLWRFVLHGRSSDWTTLARSYLDLVLDQGGVFHLWGHSWEVEHTNQWRRLEEVLRHLSQFTNQAPGLSNGQVCQAVAGGSQEATVGSRLVP